MVTMMLTQGSKATVIHRNELYGKPGFTVMALRQIAGNLPYCLGYRKVYRNAECGITVAFASAIFGVDLGKEILAVVVVPYYRKEFSKKVVNLKNTINTRIYKKFAKSIR